jgi:hypothetical protein
MPSMASGRKHVQLLLRHVNVVQREKGSNRQCQEFHTCSPLFTFFFQATCPMVVARYQQPDYGEGSGERTQTTVWEIGSVTQAERRLA